MQTVTYMMAIGKMIRQTVLVFTNISKEHNTKDIGKTTNSMEKEKRNGQMVRSMKAPINTAKKKGLAHLIGQTAPVTKATSSTITSMEKEHTSGQMAVSSLVNGKTTKCTAEACSSGLMVEPMKANT